MNRGPPGGGRARGQTFRLPLYRHRAHVPFPFEGHQGLQAGYRGQIPEAGGFQPPPGGRRRRYAGRNLPGPGPPSAGAGGQNRGPGEHCPGRGGPEKAPVLSSDYSGEESYWSKKSLPPHLRRASGLFLPSPPDSQKPFEQAPGRAPHRKRL